MHDEEFKNLNKKQISKLYAQSFNLKSTIKHVQSWTKQTRETQKRNKFSVELIDKATSQ